MLLDTHVWIWSAAGETARIGPKTRRQLEKAAAKGGLMVSSASAFEIAALVTMGRLVLSLPAERWVRDSVTRGRLQVVDAGLDVGLDAGAIPASAIGDPLDRWLVATARSLDVPLVTCDRALLAYAASSRQVAVLDARW